MGHRHQTYILVTDMVEKKSELTVYHCQWNYPEIQIPKVLRFAKYFTQKVLERMYRWDGNTIAKTYEYTASLAKDGIVRHTDITDEYRENKDVLYGEDNNNGWTLIHVKMYDDPKDNIMLIGFKPGSEDVHHRGKKWDDYLKYDFMNVYRYLELVMSREERRKTFDNLNKTEKKLLERINNMGFDNGEHNLRDSADILKITADKLYRNSVTAGV